MSAPDELFVVGPVGREVVADAFLDERTAQAYALASHRPAPISYKRAPTAPQGAEPVACPNHHYRAGGYCPHCQQHLHPAVCNLSQREYDDLVRDAMKWRARAVADAAAPQGAEIAMEALETVRHWIDDEPQDKPPYWAIRQMIAALTPTEETKHE